jgi:sulfur-carrier protein adenylyltransferase/sulfurtransferase
MTTLKIPNSPALLHRWTGRGDRKRPGCGYSHAQPGGAISHARTASLQRHGDLRNFVNLFLGENNIKDLQGLETPLNEGDTLRLIPSIAGGSSDFPGTARRGRCSRWRLRSVTGGTNAPRITRDEILRYSRHLLIPEVGLEGQRKLKGSSALVIGTGGLGSPVALYLAAAGVGRIGLVDYDVVDSSNLQRQVIHGTDTIGVLKVESARERMLDLNPDIEVEVYNEPFTSENAMRIARITTS